MPQNVLEELEVTGEMKVNPDPQRVRLIKEVRQLLFDGMKNAEQSKNWDLFTRYADFYRRISA